MRKAITLNELIIVLVIIGILAAIGTPQIFKGINRAKQAEAVQILGSVRHAQLIYANVNGQTTNKLTDLDITIPDLKYYNKESLKLWQTDLKHGKNKIAEISRKDKKETLTITLNGDISIKNKPVNPYPVEPTELTANNL